MALFGRQVILQVGTAGDSGRSFSGIRVTFQIKMSRASSPNEAVLEAYNLSPTTIALVQAEGAIVRLLAGYDVPRLLFQGNPTKNGVRLDRRGPDRVLHIEAKDGGTAYQTSRINVSFSTQTSMEQVVAALTTQLGLPTGTIRVDPSFVFPQGVALAGPARDVLDRLAQATGSDWFIRDGALHFIGEGEDTGEEAIVLSASAGNLIGSPAPKDNGVEVTALLAPTLRPGKPFMLESADYNGIYVAGDVEFQGDSGFDNPFYVKTTGTPRS